MSLRLITAATANCVTKADARTWFRGRFIATEDDLIGGAIKTAESYAENYCKRAFMQQTWRLTLDAIPDDGIIELPRAAPLSTPSTASIAFTYTGTTGGTITMPSTCYTIDAESEPARIYKSYDASWPTDIRNHKDVITVEYVCGVTSAAVVDERVKTWMKMRIGAVYVNRESFMVGTGNFVDELPRSFVDGLLDELCIIEVAQ